MQLLPGRQGGRYCSILTTRASMFLIVSVRVPSFIALILLQNASTQLGAILPSSADGKGRTG